MMRHTLFLIILLVAGCGTRKHQQVDVPAQVSDSVTPLTYHPELIPAGQIIHRGIFSNDLQQYYMTISDTAFNQFDVLVSQQINGLWTDPKPAFFNSEYSEHGMSFSPDGNQLFFASTRSNGGSDNLWQLYQSEMSNGQWSAVKQIEIPGMETKHLLHPCLAPDGTLYFQVSDLNYSNLGIYYAPLENGQLGEPEELNFKNLAGLGLCTPYISTDGRNLFFAAVEGAYLELYVCKSTGQNQWSAPVKLPPAINQKGQGNPYLTPDNKYLFYAREGETSGWEINWVNTDSFLKE